MVKRTEDGRLCITDERLGAFILSLEKESDRALVIIVGTVLEERLKKILNEFLIQNKESHVFIGRNLGCLEALNRAVFCMGLISHWEYRFINRIRILRNSFAHQFIDKGFDGTLEAKKAEVFGMLAEFMPGHDRNAFETSRAAFQELAVNITWTIWERSYEIGASKSVAHERD